VWIQPDTSQKLLFKSFDFSAVDMRDSIKTIHTKPSTFCYLAKGQIISEAQELVHSNKGDRKGYSEKEYRDLEQ